MRAALLAKKAKPTRPVPSSSHELGSGASQLPGTLHENVSVPAVPKIKTTLLTFRSTPEGFTILNTHVAD